MSFSVHLERFVSCFIVFLYSRRARFNNYARFCCFPIVFVTASSHRIIASYHRMITASLIASELAICKRNQW